MCYEKRDTEQARACFERDQRKDDYISRKALLAEYDRVHVGAPGGARKLMEDAPAADVAPVVHGRWIVSEEYNDVIEMDVVKYSCSACGEYRLSATTLSQATNYCPNCGARMDGTDDV